MKCIQQKEMFFLDETFVSHSEIPLAQQAFICFNIDDIQSFS